MHAFAMHNCTGPVSPDDLSLAEKLRDALTALEQGRDLHKVFYWFTPDDLRALLAAVEWQPIETVPQRCGKVLLLARSGEVYFGRQRGGDDIWAGQWVGSDGNAIDMRMMTHWMPLQVPPSRGKVAAP